MADIKEIFRAYDIRGNTEENLTPEVMEKIGKSFGTFVKEKGKSKVVVGHDARNTSEKLSEAFINGLKTTGLDKIVFLGLETFGTALFYGWKNGFETAFITASHLPPEWNGVKFYREDGVGYLEEENYEIRDIFLEENFVEDGDTDVEEVDYREDYIDHVVGKVDGGSLDILMDCGNGVAGLTAPRIFRELGFNVDVLYEEPDGSFPNRESDVNDESVSELREKVEDYDLGIAYDGDSDRTFLITPEGKILQADETAYLVLDKMLEESTGTVVANVECSKRIEDVAEKYGADVERVRVGHTYLFKSILEDEGVFGVERAGHFGVPHIFPLDDGVAASAFFASQVSKFEDLQGELESIPDYPNDRVPFKCSDSKKFEVIEQLQEELSEEYEKTSTVDGIRVELDYGWALIRASNTSAKIRITAEAEDKESFSKILNKFSKVLEEKIREVDN